MAAFRVGLRAHPGVPSRPTRHPPQSSTGPTGAKESVRYAFVPDKDGLTLQPGPRNRAREPSVRERAVAARHTLFAVRPQGRLPTGAPVRAVAPEGEKAGTPAGRAAGHASGRCGTTTAQGAVQGTGRKHVRLLPRADGYAYTWKEEGVFSRTRRTRSPRPTHR